MFTLWHIKITYQKYIIMITTILATLIIVIPIGLVMSLFISFFINAYYDIQEWVTYTYKYRHR